MTEIAYNTQKALIILLMILGGGLHTVRGQQISLSGSIPHQNGNQIHLTGAHHLDIPIAIDTAGQFGVALPTLPADFYNLTGVGDLYLVPGDSLTVNPELVFTGQGALENNLLQQTKKLGVNYPYIGASGVVALKDQLSPDTFLYRLNEYEGAALKIFDQSGNSYFIRLAKQSLRANCVNLLGAYQIEYGFDFDALNRQTTLIRHKEKDSLFTFNKDSANKAVHPRVFTSAQKHLFDSLYSENHDLNDSTMYVHFKSYRLLVNNIVTTKLIDNMNSGKISAMMDFQLAHLILARQLIQNPFILREEAYTSTWYVLGESSDQPLKDSMYQAYMASTSDSVLHNKIDGLYHHDKAYADHRPAPDFTYSDTSGNYITLSSLRGKYVYIDVWATWCGPCKEEIPYFKELAEAYKGKNIYFLGLSIDRLSDKKTWAAFVRDNQMAGIQVLADKEWESDFVKQFGIQGIPRFILIDPKGNVVSTNDRRPSDEGLKGELDKLLSL